MANPNLRDPAERKKIIDDIKSWENVKRKKESLKVYEIFNDNAYPYVYEELAHQLSVKTADQMPVISNLNIAKSVVNKEATIYIDEPVRSYESISASDAEVLKKLYADCGFNSKLGKANKYYKLRNQTFIQVVPKEGKLKLRVLQPHNLDVIPDADNQEEAFAYVISNFDKTEWLKVDQDQSNQKTADVDDYKATLERFQVWTKELVITMNGKGDVIGEIIDNPIQMLPFIDVAKDKDFEFYVRIGQALTDFTVDFNVAWSDLMYTARLQGYSVGVLQGDAKLKPESMTIGANKLLFLPVNPNNPESKLDFDFKSPTPNIEASLKAVESLVATFLSTRGLDTKAVQVSNSGGSYSSALEKLLSMIDQFKATKDDFDLFKVVENQLHKIVTAYLSLLSGTNLLDPKYNVTAAITKSEVSIQYKTPEMVETTAEKLSNSEKKIALGVADRVSVLMDLEGLSEEQALEKIKKIDARKALTVSSMINDNMTDDVEDEDEAEDEE